MKLKLVSKESMGVILLLFVVLLLSQSRFFDFLFHTTLGRAVFILLLLLISYAHKVLGVVAVLIAVIMFNVKDDVYYEGFDASGNLGGGKKSIVSAIASNVTSSLSSNDTSNDASNNSTNTNGTKAKIVVAKKKSEQDISGNVATEGFDLLGTENTLKRGKKSNSIPVSNSVRKSENVEPFFQSSFGNTFSSF